MPTNWKNTFHPEVLLHPKLDRTSWKHHFTGCAREYIGYLEKLASRNDNRFVFVRDRTAARRTNGKFRNGERKGKSYSPAMIEKVKRLLRERNIISPEIGMAPDGVTRNGFVVAPHDSLCKCYGTVCRYLGVGLLPATWAQVPGMGPVWMKDDRADMDFGQAFVVEEVGPVASQLNAIQDNIPQLVGRQLIEGMDESAEFYGHGSGTGSESKSCDANQNTELTTPGVANSTELLNRDEPPYPCEPSEPKEPCETEEPCESKSGGANHSSSFSLTHAENPRPSASRGDGHLHLKSIGSHFENATEPPEVLLRVTDGLLRSSSVSEYRDVALAVLNAVKERTVQPLVDRKTLAEIMNRAIGLLRQPAPRPFFKIMKDFQEQGGEIVSATPSRPTPEAQRLPGREEYSKFLRGLFKDYRDLWQTLDAMLTNIKDLDDRPGVAAERENFYDLDVAPNKPPASWRSQ